MASEAQEGTGEATEEIFSDPNLHEGITLGSAQNEILDLLGDDPDAFGHPEDEWDDEEESEDPDEDLEDEDDDDSGDEDDLEDEEDDDDDEADDDDDEEDPEGDDDAEDEDEQTDPSDDKRTYKVTVDGEEETVTLRDALDGYMRQRDYTKKSMANSDTRKELAEKERMILGLEKQYVDDLDLVAGVLRGGLPENPDWVAIKAQAPTTYAKIRDEWDQRQAQLTALRDKKSEIMSAARERQASLRKAKLQEEAELLKAKIPEWVDATVEAREKEMLADVAINEYNLTPEELEEVIDHRFLLILRDAARGREKDSKGEEAKSVKRRSRRKSKTLKSGRRGSTSGSKKSKSKRSEAARKRLSQSGSIHDAADAILDLFED